jgi:hypothetical protein
MADISEKYAQGIIYISQDCKGVSYQDVLVWKMGRNSVTIQVSNGQYVNSSQQRLWGWDRNFHTHTMYLFIPLLIIIQFCDYGQSSENLN